MITPPQGDLAEALRNGPTDPNFDLKRWEQEWAAAEAEMKRMNEERFDLPQASLQQVSLAESFSWA